MTTAQNALLVRSIGVRRFADALREGIAAFPRYRSQIPGSASYTRFLLYADNEFELVAMRWAPKSVSPVHDHGTSQCWALVAEGSLHVENYERLDDGTGSYAQIALRSTSLIGSGELDYRSGFRELHRVGNRSEVPAFTLHLYSKPLKEYTVVDANGRCSLAAARFDAMMRDYA